MLNSTIEIGKMGNEVSQRQNRKHICTLRLSTYFQHITETGSILRSHLVGAGAKNHQHLFGEL